MAELSPALRDVFAPELSAVASRRPFTVLDGGLSTVLAEIGESPAGPLWTAELLVDRPEVITAAHRRYVDAGADVIISSSYQASGSGFVAAGFEPAAARRALASTTAVARASGAAVVACSVGPFGACLADGSEYHGRYSASWSEVREFHRARLEVLVETDPDLFAIETIPTGTEAEIIVDVLRSLTSVPAWVSFTCTDDTHTCGGETLADAVDRIVAGVDAVGVNCTAPQFVAPLLGSLSVGVPLVAYPNHGAHWNADQRGWSSKTRSAEIPDLVPSWLAAGARIVGGCCGVGSLSVGVPLVAYPNHGAHWNADQRGWSSKTRSAEIPDLVPSWLAAGARIVGGCCGVGSAGIAELAALRMALAH